MTQRTDIPWTPPVDRPLFAEQPYRLHRSFRDRVGDWWWRWDITLYAALAVAGGAALAMSPWLFADSAASGRAFMQRCSAAQFSQAQCAFLADRDRDASD